MAEAYRRLDVPDRDAGLVVEVLLEASRQRLAAASAAAAELETETGDVRSSAVRITRELARAHRLGRLGELLASTPAIDPAAAGAPLTKADVGPGLDWDAMASDLLAADEDELARLSDQLAGSLGARHEGDDNVTDDLFTDDDLEADDDDFDDVDGAPSDAAERLAGKKVVALDADDLEAVLDSMGGEDSDEEDPAIPPVLP